MKNRIHVLPLLAMFAYSLLGCTGAGNTVANPFTGRFTGTVDLSGNTRSAGQGFALDPLTVGQNQAVGGAGTYNNGFVPRIGLLSGSLLATGNIVLYFDAQGNNPATISGEGLSWVRETGQTRGGPERYVEGSVLVRFADGTEHPNSTIRFWPEH